MKKLDEKTMNAQERFIPELAEGAVKQAYCKTLAAGRKVVEVVGGNLVESRPDGTSKIIKRLPPPTPVKPGQKLVRKKR